MRAHHAPTEEDRRRAFCALIRSCLTTHRTDAAISAALTEAIGAQAVGDIPRPRLNLLAGYIARILDRTTP